MKCFITGLSSVVGQHLAQILMSEVRSVDVAGCGTRPVESQAWNARYFQCNVSDRPELTKLLESERPERIYHLAGSADALNIGRMIQVNIAGTSNLLQVCHDIGLRDTRILLVGSAAGFGEMLDQENGLGDDRTARPESFYGITREAALQFGMTAARLWNLNVFLCRPFNLIGPGLGASYVATSLLKRMIEARERGFPSIELADQDAVRDFIDIRDAARAFAAIIEHGRPLVPYSIGCGVGVTIRQLAEVLARELSLNASIVPKEPANDGGPPIRSGIRRSIADIGRLHSDTGWQPQVSLAKSLRDMVEHHENPSLQRIQRKENTS